MHTMQETTVKKLIRYFGNITTMAKKVGLSRTSIYRYLNGAEIRESIARRIESKSSGTFSYNTLISSKSKYYLELDTFPDSLIKLALTDIVAFETTPRFINQKNLLVPNQRAICVNENNHLIYGLEAIENCKKQGKKTVLAWRISLPALLNRNYKIDTLKKAFNSMERAAIGIFLEERCIGNRQGQRTDLTNKQKEHFQQILWEKFPEVKEKRTLSLIAYLLGFGNNHRKTYEQAKQILQHGCAELIELISQKKILISKAARLAKLPQEEQIKNLRN